MTNKQSKPIMLIFSMPILLALLSIGCNLSGMLSAAEPAEEFSVPTRTPMPTFTPTPEGINFVAVDPIVPAESAGLDDAPAPASADEVAVEGAAAQQQNQAEITPTPTLVVQETLTPAPTNTPESTDPVAVVQSNMNVRGGPGTNYPVIGAAAQGDSSKVIGRNGDSSWMLVEYPSTEGKGWVYANLLQVTGDTSALPVAQPFRDPLPPQPVVEAQPEPQEEAAPPPPPQKQYQFTPDAWHASENAGIVHFKGRIKDEYGNMVNGYSVLLDNWSWRVLSHPTGASQWYPEKGPGEWDVVMDNLSSAQGWWWVSVVRYECDFFGGFDSQCSNYTILSEEVKIEVVTPKHSVINANWICHWDCDKGLYQRSFLRDEGYVGP